MIKNKKTQWSPVVQEYYNLKQLPSPSTIAYLFAKYHNVNKKSETAQESSQRLETYYLFGGKTRYTGRGNACFSVTPSIRGGC